jgi:hypothetical protein
MDLSVPSRHPERPTQTSSCPGPSYVVVLLSLSPILRLECRASATAQFMGATGLCSRSLDGGCYSAFPMLSVVEMSRLSLSGVVSTVLLGRAPAPDKDCADQQRADRH